MTSLCDVYEAIVPATIAFVSRSARTPSGGDPLMPTILGTGFIVSKDGIAVTNRHVAELLTQLPPHPVTKEAGYAAVMFDIGKEDDGQPNIRWMMLEIVSVGMVNQFSSDSAWHGEDKPDIAFVHLSIRDTPHLELASESFYVRPGTSIATAGFPLGTVPLTMMEKVNQVTPFLRRGIVSSVFPFSIPRPHGFTIDVMQQGGSSGSPIFYDDRPVVVGMMASVLVNRETVPIGNAAVLIPQPTNISIAVPSHMIQLALASFRQSPWAMDSSGFQTLEQWRAGREPIDTLNWERFPVAPADATKA